MATWHQQQNPGTLAMMYAPEKFRAKVVQNPVGEMASVMTYSGPDADKLAQEHYDMLVKRGKTCVTLIRALKP